MRHCLLQLAIDSLRLLAAWWRTDRPRIARREGQLLRIAPPAIVRVNSELAEVLSRTAGQTVQGAYVVYDCRAGQEACQLRITPLAGHAASDIQWIRGGGQQSVTEDEIEVFPLRERS